MFQLWILPFFLFRKPSLYWLLNLPSCGFWLLLLETSPGFCCGVWLLWSAGVSLEPCSLSERQPLFAARREEVAGFASLLCFRNAKMDGKRS